MEFDGESFTFHHPNLLVENLIRPESGNGLFMGASSSLANNKEMLNQGFPNFSQFTKQGSSSLNNPFSGPPTPFYDPFDPFQTSSSPSASSGGLFTTSPFALGGAKKVLMHANQSKGYFSFPLKSSLPLMDEFQNYSLPLDYVGIGSVTANLQEEVSCVTTDDGDQKRIMIKSTKKKRKKKKKKMLQAAAAAAVKNRGLLTKSNVIKGQWSPEEDRMLVMLVEKHGIRKWSQISQVLPGRVGKQCRERWHNHLRPDIKKDKWSEEEDGILIEAHQEMGNKWAEIARRLPGRSENSIKNHWNATKRRQLSWSSRKKNNNKSSSSSNNNNNKKKPRCSTLLQTYIQTLISSSPSSSSSITAPAPAPAPSSNGRQENTLLFSDYSVVAAAAAAYDNATNNDDFSYNFDDTTTKAFGSNNEEERCYSSCYGPMLLEDSQPPQPPPSASAAYSGVDNRHRHQEENDYLLLKQFELPPLDYLDESEKVPFDVKKEMDFLEMLYYQQTF